MKTETKAQVKKAEKNAIALNREIQSATQDVNNVYSTSNVVSPMMQTHYVNMETGEKGITGILKEILTFETDTIAACINPDCIVNEGDVYHFADDKKTSPPTPHEFRKVAIARSMFIGDIMEKVQDKWTAGTIRYPKETVETYLSVFLVRRGLVGKIKLTKNEDCENRPKNWSKPRVKFFAIQGKENILWTEI